MTKALCLPAVLLVATILTIEKADVARCDGPNPQAPIRRPARAKIKPGDREAMEAAEKVKAAMLEMIPANQSIHEQFKEDFGPEKVEKLKLAPMERLSLRNPNLYLWDVFKIDLKNGSYSAVVGNQRAMRIYSGKLSVNKNGQWTAGKPAISFLDSPFLK